MSGVLVDTNVISDLITENAIWFEWSAAQIEKLAESNPLYINPIIYSEISIPFSSIEDLRAALPEKYFTNLPFTEEVSFLAGKAFLEYRKNGGTKSLPLPDFFIGAHAAILKLKLITRDVSRYSTYFPTVELISPP